MCSQAPELIEKYCKHIYSITENTDAVYILGDLFDYWIGPENKKDYKKVIEYLQIIAKKSPVYFMPGSRDFLLEKKCLETIGVELIQDPFTIDYDNKKILLSHGDIFCTDDTSYQRLKTVIQNKWIKKAFLKLPFAYRTFIAKKLRLKSSKSTRKKPSPMMNACQQTILSYLQKHKANTCIHGHVHKLSHTLPNVEQNIELAVLDSWEHQVNHITLNTKHSNKICHIYSFNEIDSTS